MSLLQLLREVVRVELKQLVRELVREEKDQVRVPRATVRKQRPATYGSSKSRSTYRGDSQTKKSARLRVWEVIRLALPKEFMQGPHVFLASKEGGDASTLRGMDVPDSAMLAVDCDAAALREFERRYPEIPNRNTDVAYALRDMEKTPASIFLDFSSQVSDQTFNKVQFALRHLEKGKVLACTFAIGREKHWNGNGDAPCEERIRMVESFVQQELGYKPRVLLRLRYTSESPTGPGSSLMFVVVFQTTPGKDEGAAKLTEIGVQDLYRDAYRYRDNPNLRWLINCSEDKTEALRKRVIEYPPPRVT